MMKNFKLKILGLVWVVSYFLSYPYSIYARVVRNFNKLPEEFGIFRQIEDKLNQNLRRPVEEIDETELMEGRQRFITVLREAVQEQDIILTDGFKLNSLGQLIKGTEVWCDCGKDNQYKKVIPRFTRNVFGEPSILQIIFEDGTTMIPSLIFLEFVQKNKVELFGGYTGISSINKLGLEVSPDGLESFPKDKYRIILYKRSLDKNGYFRLFSRGKVLIKFPKKYKNVWAGATLVFDERGLSIEVILLRDKAGRPILEDGKPVSASVYLTYTELKR